MIEWIISVIISTSLIAVGYFLVVAGMTHVVVLFLSMLLVIAVVILIVKIFMYLITDFLEDE